MLYQFLEVNRAVLIERCREKVARRSSPEPTIAEMEHGIPLFLTQLIETLRNEQPTPESRSVAPVAPPGPAIQDVPGELASSAAEHGGNLLRRGFTVDQVVHDYGDLCQAVTELAIEQD